MSENPFNCMIKFKFYLVKIKTACTYAQGQAVSITNVVFFFALIPFCKGK